VLGVAHDAVGARDWDGQGVAENATTDHFMRLWPHVIPRESRDPRDKENR